MKMLLIGAALLSAASAPTTQDDTGSNTVPYEILASNDFQAFVKNWEGDSLCAALTSQADWDRYMASAGAANASRPYRPTADFWNDNVAFLIARVAGGRATLTVESVLDADGGLDIATRLEQESGASYRTKAWAMVAVSREMPDLASVTFSDADGTTCTAQLGE